MFVKLTFRNVKRSAKEYGLFLLTMILCMTMMYTYFAVFSSHRIMALSILFERSSNGMILFGFCIALILSWLINYVVNCIFKRRSQEFGLYLLSGISRRQVTLMFLFEQILMGLMALGLGIFLGIFVSQVMEALIMQLFSMPYHFSFTSSLHGVAYTVLFFFVLYALASIKEFRLMKKITIIDLLKRSACNEPRNSSKHTSILFFIIALAMLCYGLWGLQWLYDTIFRKNVSFDITIFFTCILSMILSVYLFYRSLSDVLLLFFAKFRMMRYHGNTMLLNASLCAKVKTNRFVIATISVLSIIIISSIFFAICFNQIFQLRVLQDVPYDITALSDVDQIGTSKLAQYLQEQHMDYQMTECRYYIFPEGVVDNTLAKVLKGTRGDVPYTSAIFMKESDATVLFASKQQTFTKLQNDQFAILCVSDLVNTMDSYEQVSLRIHGKTLQNADIIADRFAQTMYAPYVTILPDAYFSDAQFFFHGVFIDTKQPTEAYMYDDTKDMITSDTYCIYRVKTQYIQVQQAMLVMTISMTLYLAFIGLCICATMLATQQITDIKQQAMMYQLLHKQGMRKKETHHLLFRQILLYYLVPLLLPCIYLPMILSFFTDIFLMNSSAFSTMQGIAISITLFLTIYFCYFLITYVSSKRVIDRDEVL